MDNKLSQMLTSSLTCPTRVGLASFVLGAAAGAGVSYILNRRKTEVLVHDEPSPLEFNAIELDNAIRKNVQPTIDISQLHSQPEDVIEDPNEHVEPADLGKAFVEKKLEEPVIIVPEAPPVVDEPVARSIFAGSDDEWNYDDELAKRSPAEPYILHADEFHENETEYSQQSLTYYAGDSILADAQDSPIYNHHLIVGELHFGHGSGDPNVVYVRNDKLKAEYEILLDTGLFTVEVMGLSIEDNQRTKDLRHSHHVPRFHIQD